MGALVVAMEAVAVLVAYLSFGRLVLLIGGLLFVGTLLVLAVVRASEGPRRRLEQRRDARWEPGPVADGLMSGFFEIPVPRGPVDVDPSGATLRL